MSSSPYRSAADHKQESLLKDYASPMTASTMPCWHIRYRSAS